MTNACRIQPLSPPYSPELAAQLEKMMGVSKREPLKLFRTLAHHERLLRRFSTMGGGILAGGQIAPREREIVIHRTCARCKCEYEWGVHVVVFGRSLGLSEAQIRATVTGSAADPLWNERESLLIRLADELHDTATLSGELWQALREHWNESELIELMITAGFYHLVSYVTNGAGVELESYAERFPNGD